VVTRLAAIAFAASVVVAAGCTAATTPIDPGSSAKSAPIATVEPSDTPTRSVVPHSSDPQVVYVQLPRLPRGEWSARGLLDNGDVLLTSNPAGPADDPSTFVSEIARFDPQSKAVTSLMRLPEAKQVIQPIAAGDTLAWIEGPYDLRAFGWRIHLTEIRSGNDRVIAVDSGVHSISNSVLPAIALGAGGLAYTKLDQGSGGPEWRLHHVSPVEGSDVVIAALDNASDSRFLSLCIDAQTLAWSENFIGQDPHTNIGVYDLPGSHMIFRGRTNLSGAYQIAASDQSLFFATQSGLLKSPRNLASAPVVISPESAPVDTVTVVGHAVLYNNFDRGNTVAAIDLLTGEHTQLAQNVTRGPVSYGSYVFWFEKASNGTPARAAVLDFSAQR